MLLFYIIYYKMAEKYHEKVLSNRIFPAAHGCR